MSAPRFETICIHHAEDPQRYEGAASPPIFQSSTFLFPDSAQFVGRGRDGSERFDYTRTGNPTTRILEKKLAALEGGDEARCCGSGMSAISGAILSCVGAGDHIVCVDTAYGPTRQFLDHYLPRFGVQTTYVPGTRAADFEAAVRERTRVIYVESPSSLVFAIQDLAAVAAFARARGITTICDNSYSGAYFQQPLRLGIDLVVHSGTKYLSGHSDVVAGAIVGGRERMGRLIEQEGMLLGGILDPFAAWLMLRGLRTLAVRLDRHQSSGLIVARALAAHPRVGRVHHAGFESHPGFDVARRQMSGTSGMFSFELKEPTREATFRVVDALQYFGIGVSWGGFESLAIPAKLRLPGEAEGRWGVRLSIGLEHPDDLIEDLRVALDAT